MQTLKLILSLLLTIFIVSLILANPWMLQQKYAVTYLGYQSPQIHLILLLLAALTIGAMITALTMLGGQLRLKGALREQRKKISQMEEELNSLRNLPLKESGNQLEATRETESTPDY